MRMFLTLLSAFLLVNIFCCANPQQEQSQSSKLNNFRLKTGLNLSDTDINNPTILALRGWKKVGYKKWDWDLKDQTTIAELNRAELIFNRAIELDPENADAVAGLAKLNLVRGYIPNSYVNYKKEACQKSWDLMKNAGTAGATTYLTCYVKSEIFRCMEDYDGSIKEAEKMQEIDDRCFPFYLKSLAYYDKYLKKKDPSDADSAIIEGTDYLECLQNRSRYNVDSEAYVNLSGLLIISKRYEATIEYFKKNIEIKPDSHWSYRNYVWILLLRSTLDDLNEAEKTIETAKKKLDLDLFSPQLYSNRSKIYMDQKKYSKAFNDYQKLLSVNPLATSNEALTEICSKFTDGRCKEIWKKRIVKYAEVGQCNNATKVFNLQYSLFPKEYELLKNVVAQCKPRNK